MNILLTNDDGIMAEGIKAIAEALNEIANVYIFAPTEQRSASGHGITINKSIAVEEMKLPYAKRAFAVDGLPADCVKLGNIIMEKDGIQIDKVVSGANHGMNLGTDTLYSGTVSAALEGVICGKPSVAISVGARWPTMFETACRMAVMAVNLPGEIFGKGTALNINVPHLSAEEIKGIRITKLGLMEYDEAFREEEPEGGLRKFFYGGRPLLDYDLTLDVDIAGHRAGFITITPLKIYLTEEELLNKLESYFYKDKATE
ncbi:5'-nucleotidase SurE [Clostridia bacterium]|nr:5'-nucleotidase SurE [Clostridia bacterium]